MEGSKEHNIKINMRVGYASYIFGEHPTQAQVG